MHCNHFLFAFASLWLGTLRNGAPKDHFLQINIIFRQWLFISISAICVISQFSTAEGFSILERRVHKTRNIYLVVSLSEDPWSFYSLAHYTGLCNAESANFGMLNCSCTSQSRADLECFHRDICSQSPQLSAHPVKEVVHDVRYLIILT